MMTYNEFVEIIYQSGLFKLWPLANYNLNDDGFGNLAIVPGIAWSAATYVAYSEWDCLDYGEAEEEDYQKKQIIQPPTLRGMAACKFRVRNGRAGGSPFSIGGWEWGGIYRGD